MSKNAEKVECEFCGKFVHDHGFVPAKSVGAWDDIAREHAQSCEYITAKRAVQENGVDDSIEE